jgi:hypothetical protein
LISVLKNLGGSPQLEIKKFVKKKEVSKVCPPALFYTLPNPPVSRLGPPMHARVL